MGDRVSRFLIFFKIKFIRLNLTDKIYKIYLFLFHANLNHFLIRYFCSMDIQHDRAGYYICWGCLNWVPSMYTFHSYYMVTHPTDLSVPVFLAIVAAGIYLLYLCYAYFYDSYHSYIFLHNIIRIYLFSMIFFIINYA